MAVGLWAAADGGPAQAQAVAPELAATLGVFRRERAASDDMPGDPVAVLRQTGDGQPGEDPSQARRVDLPGATRPAFLWPMNGGVCYSAPEGGSGCVPIARIRASGVELAVSSAIRRDSVTLRYADGREVAVTVRESVFFADLDDMPDELRWQDARGTHTRPVAGEFDSATLERFR